MIADAVDDDLDMSLQKKTATIVLVDFFLQ